ncbi:MAG: wax ester/triacylglycerol synthase family O-acyltransferase [Solirubrobacteraceae bacterium]
MTQAHLDLLSAADAAILAQERGPTHMHIGALGRFHGPPPELDELFEHVSRRLNLVPRFRQKLATPPLGLGRPRWIDDPTFNLAYHVRHTALPAPGTEAELRALIGRIFSQQLDRTKPLWELWMVEGLGDGGFALVSKTHQALVDGVSGADLMTTLFDLDPEAPDTPVTKRWTARPAPSTAQLAAAALGDTARGLTHLPLGTLARGATEGIGQLVRAGMSPAPHTPLNVAISPHRRVAFLPTPLDGFRAIKDALGATVNDVVVAVTAGALREWMHSRGLRTEGVGMRAGVPVSTTGDRIVELVVPLPIDVSDPVARLERIREATASFRESGEALGADAIAAAQGFAPPTILARASRMAGSARLYNVLVTNIPGPQFPLHLLGRRMERMFPIAFLRGDKALGVAVMSYDGTLGFGLIGDLDAMPDLDVVRGGLEASIAEYAALV